MQLFKKEKIFQIFFCIFKFLIKFQTFGKKMPLIADLFTEIPTPKYIVRKISKKPCFRGPLDRQHGKCVETL